MSALPVWEVPSVSRPALTHLVMRLPDGRLTCTCEAAHYGRMCRHRVAVLMQEEEPMTVTHLTTSAVTGLPQRLTSPVAADWDTDEQRIIREQVAGGMNPPITDVELRYFASVCQARGLNPIAGQIVPVRRSGRMVIQVTIHGLRAIADATGNYAPGPLTTFVENAAGLVSATASVLKYAQGTWHTVSEVAAFDEYCEVTSQGRPQALWGTKPRVMLAKCAEALALRRAFPIALGGLYVDAELAQADPADQGLRAGGQGSEVREPDHRADTASQRPRSALPQPSAPGPQPPASERPDFDSFWRTVREQGFQPADIQSAAVSTWHKQVPHLTREQLAELRDAVLGARLVANAEGVWSIQPIGGASEEAPAAE
jgi:phage recombination protein Bet